MEWAGQHDQAGFITYLQSGSGNAMTSFVRAGGKVVDSQVCEYPEKIDAVSVTAEQMQNLLTGNSASAGIAYVLAAVGPCASTWTAGDGTVVTNKGLSTGEEGIEVDVTTTQESSALGSFLVKTASWDQGDGTTADSLIEQVGI